MRNVHVSGREPSESARFLFPQIYPGPSALVLVCQPGPPAAPQLKPTHPVPPFSEASAKGTCAGHPTSKTCPDPSPSVPAPLSHASAAPRVPQGGSALAVPRTLHAHFLRGRSLSPCLCISSAFHLLSLGSLPPGSLPLRLGPFSLSLSLTVLFMLFDTLLPYLKYKTLRAENNVPSLFVDLTPK